MQTNRRTYHEATNNVGGPCANPDCTERHVWVYDEPRPDPRAIIDECLRRFDSPMVGYYQITGQTPDYDAIIAVEQEPTS